jgi:hypothetical protein
MNHHFYHTLTAMSRCNCPRHAIMACYDPERWLPGTQADLDEAEEIAERGAMKLHLCDVHLSRTRLYLASGQAPRCLVAAKGIVEDCGYGRRAGEVEGRVEAEARRASHGSPG